MGHMGPHHDHDYNFINTNVGGGIPLTGKATKIRVYLSSVCYTYTNSHTLTH